MLLGRTLPLPGWSAVSPEAFDECYRVLYRMPKDERDRGAAWALDWFAVGEVGPMTSRAAAELSWETARAESWVALCVAAGQPEPTERDWQRLGATPRPAAVTSREFAYGVWRALAWLLGVREDWPTYTSWHRAAELPPERPHMHVPHTRWHTPVWEAAAAACRERDEADALVHWRHVRRLADATDTGTGADRVAGCDPSEDEVVG